MMTVDMYVTGEGLRIRARAVCTGKCMQPERHQGRAHTVDVSSVELEHLTFTQAISEALYGLLREYDELLELLDH